MNNCACTAHHRSSHSYKHREDPNRRTDQSMRLAVAAAVAVAVVALALVLALRGV